VVESIHNKIEQECHKPASLTSRELILDFIKRKEPCSQEDIEKDLRNASIDISEPRRYRLLKKLLDKKEITGLRKSSGSKSIFRRIANKIWRGSNTICYFFTPRSAGLYDDLRGLIKNLPNQSKYQSLINKICNIFSSIEVVAKSEMHSMFSDKTIEGLLKKKGIESPTEEDLKKEKQSVLNDLLKFSNTTTKLGITGLENHTTNFDGKDYIKIGDDLINFDRFGTFLNIPRKRMSHIMVYVAYYTQENRNRILAPMTLSMAKLFIEIEKDKQIKNMVIYKTQ